MINPTKILQKTWTKYHIDFADRCCMRSWMNGSAEPIGWMEAPYGTLHLLAIVCECPNCFTKWWTHYPWVPIPPEFLSKPVQDLLDEEKINAENMLRR